MSLSKSKVWSVPGLLFLAVMLLAAIALSNQLFTGARLDLTDGKLYTMTDGTQNILDSIDEPINLYFYFSDTSSAQYSSLRSYAKRVRETLEEYALRSGGKITLHVIDPLPFSEEEDEAAQLGIQAVPVSSAGDAIYFGLAGTNSLDDQSIIPFFQAEKEAFLEYDLSKLVHSLSSPSKTVVGLMSALPVAGSFNPINNQQTPEWTIIAQIKQLFEVKTVPTTAISIPDNIDVLMLVHPKELSEDSVFGIEQFLLNGGHALIFVDPYADADQPVTDPNDPTSMFQSRASNLPKLFAQWGVNFTGAQFVADKKYALAIRNANGMGQINHLGLIGATQEVLNQDDVISADLDSINFAYTGAISVRDDAAVTFEPLIRSSVNSALMDAQTLVFSQDPAELQNTFQADENDYVLAARISGTVRSAFPDRFTDTENSTFKQEGTINAVIFADTDLLVDGFWVRVQNFFGRKVASAFASNGDIVFNALDNLTGSSDLISIRGRETFQRPFKVVDELKRKADEEFRNTEERLQQELTTTEQRLTELQSSRTDQGSPIMSPEQQAEIDSFLEQKVAIRKQLREVRRSLDKDIKDLGFRLKAINILLVPLLLVLFALFSAWRRHHKVQS